MVRTLTEPVTPPEIADPLRAKYQEVARELEAVDADLEALKERRKVLMESRVRMGMAAKHLCIDLEVEDAKVVAEEPPEEDSAPPEPEEDPVEDEAEPAQEPVEAPQEPVLVEKAKTYAPEDLEPYRPTPVPVVRRETPPHPDGEAQRVVTICRLIHGEAAPTKDQLENTRVALNRLVRKGLIRRELRNGVPLYVVPGAVLKVLREPEEAVDA